MRGSDEVFTDLGRSCIAGSFSRRGAVLGRSHTGQQLAFAWRGYLVLRCACVFLLAELGLALLKMLDRAAVASHADHALSQVHHRVVAVT